ncbi:hypothetical protein D7223_01020 [Micromonospora endolithica]|uniref:Uncharacterized protein n=1 Tax=Micromonospora endolithica TaxID=230091 RepID=A0A3A9ZQF5_9ACTN|nr:hypothetical protein D7223_01020 [Micromonospora endolithica]
MRQIVRPVINRTMGGSVARFPVSSAGCSCEMLGEPAALACAGTRVSGTAWSTCSVVRDDGWQRRLPPVAWLPTRLDPELAGGRAQDLRPAR